MGHTRAFLPLISELKPLRRLLTSAHKPETEITVYPIPEEDTGGERQVYSLLGFKPLFSLSGRF